MEKQKCRRCGKVEVEKPYRYCYKCSQILINGWEKDLKEERDKD